MSQFALEITDLKKTYDSDVVALKGINLSVKEGDFFALLGPNGAGKSTTIGIIASLVTKTAGKVKIFNIDTDKNFPEAKRLLGVVSQEINFNNFEKVIDIVNELLQFNMNVDVYDPKADKQQVFNEFGINLIDSITEKYEAIVLTVPHKEFFELNIKSLFSSNQAILFDIKSVLDRSIVTSRL